MASNYESVEGESFESVFKTRLGKEVRVYVATSHGGDPCWDILGELAQVLDKTIILKRTGFLQRNNTIAIARSRIVAIGWNA